MPKSGELLEVLAQLCVLVLVPGAEEKEKHLETEIERRGVTGSHIDEKKLRLLIGIIIVRCKPATTYTIQE